MIYVKRKLTPEEKFNLKLEKFLKTSKEILKDAIHKRHTNREERQLKLKNNTSRRLKNKHKNY